MVSWKGERWMRSEQKPDPDQVGSTKRSKQRTQRERGSEPEEIFEDTRPGVVSANDPEIPEGSLRIVDGEVCRKTYSGMSIRQWYQHGPTGFDTGPGWGRNMEALPLLGVDEMDVYDPRKWPTDPYFTWEPVDILQKDRRWSTGQEFTSRAERGSDDPEPFPTVYDQRDSRKWGIDDGKKS